MTQKEFAEHLGKSTPTIQKWEYGGKVPDSSMKMICKTFGINEAWLMTGKGEMFDKSSGQYASGKNISFGNFIQINTSSERVRENMTTDMKELIELIAGYATPSMIAEWKKKLLQIKKLHEE